MRRGLAFLALLSLAGASCGDAPVSVDPVRHTVTFTARATGCPANAQLEFLFVGPNSDHDYEALFVTDATPTVLADAFRQAGIPCGRPVDNPAWRFWPVGTSVTLTPTFSELVREMRGERIPRPIYTGGARDAADLPVATTNSPFAVFALYNCGQSLLQLDDSLDQSPTYGRFQPARELVKGESRTFTVSWDGRTTCPAFDLQLRPGRLPEALADLKAKSAEGELDVCCDFSPELTLEEAIAAASALNVIDSPALKINGVKEGQLYFRAYLPLEKWRNRSERLSQPPEIHLLDDGTFCVRETQEDWSDPDSLDPKLTVIDHPCADVARAASCASGLVGKTYSVFLYAAPTTRLEALYRVRAALTGSILNWYVFTK